MLVNLYCDNRKCNYNIDLLCTARHVYHVKERCVTFKPGRDNYRELMRSNVGVCHREHGKMKRNEENVLK